MALLVFVLAASPLHAAFPHKTRWTVVGNTEAAGVSRERNEIAILGRMVPEKLLRLEDNAIVPKGARIAIPKGRLMVPIDGDSSKICELIEHEGSSFACLSDTDGDGAFDTYFGTQVFNAFFLGSIGDDGGFARIANEVRASPVTPLTESPLVQIGIRYLGLSNGQMKLQICAQLGSDDSYGLKYFKGPSCQRHPIVLAIVGTKASIDVYGMAVDVSQIEKNRATFKVVNYKHDDVVTTSFSFPF